MNGVLNWIAAATAQIERPQIRINLTEIGHRWDDAVFQNLDGDHVLDADAHRVAGEALCVGHDDAVGRLAKGVTQGHDLG